MRILLLALAVLLAQQLQVTPPPPPVPLFVDEFARGGAIPQDGEGVIHGLVRRVDTGEGLRDVAIRLTREQASGTPMTLSTTTDNAGKYEFKHLPFGSYTVLSTREGYFFPSPNDIPITVGMNRVTLDALHKTVPVTTDFIPGGVIAGSVHDSNGTPAVNVRVTVLRTGYRKGRPALTAVKTANTDDRGAFRVAGLAPAEYYVRADVPLEPVVTDPQVERNITSFTLLGGSGLSNDPNLAAVASSFSPIYAPGSALPTNAVSFKVRGGQEIGVDISLPQRSPVRISGTVIGTLPRASKAPIGFLLIPRNPDVDEGRPNLLKNVAANQSGRHFEVVTTRPGVYDLVAVLAKWSDKQIGARTIEMLGLASGRTPVDVRDRDITDIQIEIVPAGDLEVRFVTPTGEPIRQVGYVLRSRDVSDTTPLVEDTGVIVNPDGRIYTTVAMNSIRRFSSLPEGEYQLEFPFKPPNTYISDMKQAGRSIYADGIVTVGKISAEPVDVIFSPGGAMVSGKIQGGEISYIHPARVTLVPQGARRSNPMFYVRANSTDGTFSLSGIAPGEYKLFAFELLPVSADENAAFMERYELSGRAISVQSNSSLANIELSLIRLPK